MSFSWLLFKATFIAFEPIPLIDHTVNPPPGKPNLKCLSTHWETTGLLVLVEVISGVAWQNKETDKQNELSSFCCFVQGYQVETDQVIAVAPNHSYGGFTGDEISPARREQQRPETEEMEERTQLLCWISIQMERCLLVLMTERCFSCETMGLCLSIWRRRSRRMCKSSTRSSTHGANSLFKKVQKNKRLQRRQKSLLHRPCHMLLKAWWATIKSLCLSQVVCRVCEEQWGGTGHRSRNGMFWKRLSAEQQIFPALVIWWIPHCQFKEGLRSVLV